MKSLFVLSLPRSLSTIVYEAAQLSLGLRRPAWTSAGEILNVDRAPLSVRRLRSGRAKFTMKEHEPVRFERLTSLLACAAAPEGFAYKDVVHPFVTSEWPGISEFCVLKIRRDPAEVAFAMLERGWGYPCRAATLGRDYEAAVVEGLLRAERALASVPGEVLDYADAIADHEALRSVLGRLYPDARLDGLSYIDGNFVLGRLRREANRRQSTRYEELRATVDAVRSSLQETGFPAVERSITNRFRFRNKVGARHGLGRPAVADHAAD
jgi:hypothetical protein